MADNCWEFMKCGREPGGAKVSELGICPAATEKSADNVNQGDNGGRICWAVVGTFCGGKTQGYFVDKFISCSICDFFRKVEDEEGDNFQFLMDHQKILIRKPSS